MSKDRIAHTVDFPEEIVQQFEKVFQTEYMQVEDTRDLVRDLLSVFVGAFAYRYKDTPHFLDAFSDGINPMAHAQEQVCAKYSTPLAYNGFEWLKAVSDLRIWLQENLELVLPVVDPTPYRHRYTAEEIDSFMIVSPTESIKNKAIDPHLIIVGEGRGYKA